MLNHEHVSCWLTIIELVSTFPIALQHHLCDICTGTESDAMLGDGMPEDLLKDSPLFQPSVDSLMTGTDNGLHSLVCIVNICWSFEELVAIVVATIS